MNSFACDDSNDIIDLSDEEFDEAMAEVTNGLMASISIIKPATYILGNFI